MISKATGGSIKKTSLKNPPPPESILNGLMVGVSLELMEK